MIVLSRKAVKSFKKLADSNFLIFGRNTVGYMTLAVDVFPTPSPPLTSITEGLDNYAELLQTSSGRDKIQVGLKNQAKLEVSFMLSQLCDYVNLTAQGSDTILLKSGFELNKIPEPVDLKAPTGLVLKDGGNSGELYLKFKGVKGASSYLCQYTTDPLLTEESWVSTPTTTSYYTFTGLTKGTSYYCRAVSIGAKKQMMYSIVVNRVSQ